MDPGRGEHHEHVKRNFKFPSAGRDRKSTRRSSGVIQRFEKRFGRNPLASEVVDYQDSVVAFICKGAA